MSKSKAVAVSDAVVVPELTVPQNTALSTVDEELAQYAVQAVAAEKPVGGAISFRAGQISWQGTPVPGNKLPCVVVGFINENRYYDKPWNPDVPSSPVCFAIGESEADMRAHDDSPQPQNGPGGSCSTCPKAAWGSAIKNGIPSRGKACAESRRLALIPHTALESAESILGAEIAIAKMPVTSIRFWSAYVNRLSSVLKRPPFAVITEISTEPHPKHQFHVHFNATGNVPNELIGAMKQKRGMAEAYLNAPYTTDNAVADEVPAGPRKF